MPSLRKRGNNWYLAVSHQGRRQEIALGPNERLARMRLDEVNAERERGKAGFAIERPAPLRERIDLWLQTHRANLAPSYYLRCQQYADRALELLDGDRVVQAADLERYKAERLQAGLKAKTVNDEVAFVKAVYNADGPGTHPFRSVKKLKIRDAKPIRWLTTEEIERMLAAAIPRARPYLLGYLFTGARREELVGLAWHQVDFKRLEINLPAPKTAGRGIDFRQVPIHPRLLEVIKAQQALGLASPWPAPRDEHRLRAWVVAAIEKAGIRPVATLHDLRHTFASHLAQSGVSLQVIGQLLGHTNPATTMKYAHLSPSSLHKAVGLLDY
jgi:integrase